MRYVEIEGEPSEVAQVICHFRSAPAVEERITAPPEKRAYVRKIKDGRGRPKGSNDTAQRRKKRMIDGGPNSRRSWSRMDEVLLVKLRDEGIGFSEIGRRLGRTGKACRERMNVIRAR